MMPIHAAEAFRSALNTAPSFALDLPGADGLSICAWRAVRIDELRLPPTDDMTVAWHRSGGRDVRARVGGVLSARRSTPGQLSIIPPGRPMAYSVNGTVAFTAVHIPAQALAAAGNAATRRDTDARFAFRDPFVTACIAALTTAGADRQRDCGAYVRALTEALLHHLVRLPADPSGRPGKAATDRIRLVQDWIEAHLGDPLDVDALAGEAGLSRAQLTRQFRLDTGLPPHAYLTMRRVQSGKRLLAQTGMPLVEIAMELGFCSQSHFTTVFRHEVGCTPGNYRRKTAAEPIAR